MHAGWLNQETLLEVFLAGSHMYWDGKAAGCFAGCLPAALQSSFFLKG
jgi:hypothetical protein